MLFQNKNDYQFLLTELLHDDHHVEDGVAVGVLGVGVGALLDQDVVHSLVTQAGGPSQGVLPQVGEALHNSDLRDSREYFQKQVWGAQNCTRQSSRRFGLLRNRLTEVSVAVCFDSAHPTYYLGTICVL